MSKKKSRDTHKKAPLEHIQIKSKQEVYLIGILTKDPRKTDLSLVLKE